MVLRMFLMTSWIATLWGADGFPEPKTDIPASGVQKVVLAGGCFWCTEAVFEHVAGVTKVISGYAGGEANDANYKAVSSGQTNHAEVIEVTFDSHKITFGQVLKIFFAVAHDPTQVNRQGPDWGRQYRSAIFYANDDQKRVAQAYIAQLNEAKVFAKPIATELAPLKAFYPAEAYHQDFVKNNPSHPYVVVNALPKVEKLKKTFPAQVRKPS